VGAKKPECLGFVRRLWLFVEWTNSDRAEEGQAVLRGGSWKDDADKLTSAYRRLEKADLRDDAVGLRCVLCAVLPRISPARLSPAGAKLSCSGPKGNLRKAPLSRRTARSSSPTSATAIYPLRPQEPPRPSSSASRAARSNGLMFNQKGT